MISSVRPQKLRGRLGVLVKTPYDEVFLGQLKAMGSPSRPLVQCMEDHSLVPLRDPPTASRLIVVDEDGREITHERSGEKLEQGRLL